MANRILVIDDDETILEFVELHLKAEGFEVVTTINPIKAIGITAEWNPDLIICDLVMPEMDGWEFCTEIRKSPDIPFIPFMFITGIQNPKIEDFSFSFGADEYLKKPFNKTQLVDHTKYLLKHTESYRRIGTSEDVQTGKIEDQSDPNVLELIQFFILSQRSGVFKIFSKKKVGIIYFKKGEIENVIFGNKKGQPAMDEIILLDKGRFEFRGSNIRVNKAITENVLPFLMEACRIADEKKKSKKDREKPEIIP